MDIGALALMIPISAIVLGIGADTVKRILQSQEKRLEMRLRLQQGQSDEVTRQLEALRAEIAGLRDTSTQFDMSLEHTVQRLEERVNRMETKNAPPSRAQTMPEEVQRIGLS